MQKKTFFSTSYFLIFISIFFSYVSCDPPKPNKLTVGVHSWPGGGPIYIGKEMGFFKEEGIDIDIRKIENFDTKRASLISGQIDIDLANTLDQLLIYNENGFKAQVIGITDESTGGDGLVAKEEIKTIEDLRGKTIAFAEASPSDFFMRYILKQKGIAITEVKLKPTADPQIAGNAIIAKQVDAAVTFEPFLSQADSTPGIHLLASTREYPTLIPGLIIASSDKVIKNEEMYTKYLHAWFKSIDYLKSNPKEGVEIIAKGMGISVAEVSAILSTIQIQDKKGNDLLLNSKDASGLHDLVKHIAEFWKQNGYIKKAVDENSIINVTLVGK